MHILFIGLCLPYPPLNGHRLRTWALVQTLAGDGHDVTLLSFADPGEEITQDSPLRKLCRSVEAIPTPGSEGESGEYSGRLRALFTPLPYGAWRFRSPTLRTKIAEVMARSHVDAILCDGVYNMVNMPVESGVPVILNKDDVAHVIMQRYLQFETNPARRLYGALESRKVKEWERRWCRDAALTLSCSEYDQGLLKALCPAGAIAVVPNVVDTGHYAPSDREEPLTVLFQGGMDWHPNRDGVEFFVSDILPELRRLVPDVTFRVAGRSPSDEFRRRFDGVPGMEFTGTVPDMRAEIARAAVCVVPLRIGSGTRLKILEAGAMAKPMVSTRLGAEGLDFVDGRDIVLADDPRAFAGAVATLLGDASRRRALGQSARRCVEERYSLPVLRTSVRSVLGDLGKSTQGSVGGGT